MVLPCFDPGLFPTLGPLPPLSPIYWEEADEPPVDMVNHPPHYAEGWSNGAELIDITENLNFNRGNCVKYVARAGSKSEDTELEDLKKARWYLEREIGRLEN